MTSNPMDTSTHLSYDQIAAYLDGVMPAEGRRQVEAHISSCDECRSEVIASREAVSTAPSPGAHRSRRWPILATLAVASIAVVAGLAIERNDAARPVVRETIQPHREVIVISPADGTKMGGEHRLLWHSVAAGASYRITLGDSQAQPIYSATVQDTTLVIPASVVMAQGSKFVWYVDAMRADGVTATSGLRSFTVE
jgi:hypothetical protein